MRKKFLFLLLIIGFFNTVYAEDDLVIRKHRFSNAYGVFDGVDRVHLFYAQSYSFNGNFAFCIEPGIAINSDTYSSTNNLSIANIDSEKMDKVRLIAYYGFAYNTGPHWNNNYYMATQELIWKEITGRDTYWVSEENINGPRINVDREKQEINTLVQNHNILPSFNNQEISIKNGETYILKDENNVLNKFTLDEENENILIDGNTIKITANDLLAGKEIKLISKSYTDKVSLIYYSGDSQKLMSVTGILDPLVVRFKINIISEPKVKLLKIDALTKEKVKLAGIKFKIKSINTGNYICDDEDCTYETDSDGEFITNSTFQHGDYQIEEVSDYVDGYYINKTPLKFVIDDDSNLEQANNEKYIIVQFENKPMLGTIEIYKQGEKYIIQDDHIVYSFDNISDVIFKLYAKDDIYMNGNLKFHKDELVSSVTINNGYAIIKDLPLGNYYLKEDKALLDYQLDPAQYDIQLSQENNNVVETISLKNYLKKGIFELTKIDKTTNIPLEGAVINIYNENNELVYSGTTNQEGMLVVEGLPLGKYYYIESKAPIDYQTDNTKHYFELSKNNQIYNANLINERTFVPSTNLDKNNYVNIFSMLIFVIGGFLFGFTKE